MKKVIRGMARRRKWAGFILILLLISRFWPAEAGNNSGQEPGGDYTIVKCSGPGKRCYIIFSQTDEVIGPLSEAALFRRSLLILLGPFQEAAISPDISEPVLRGILLAPIIMTLPHSSLPALLLFRSLNPRVSLPI